MNNYAFLKKESPFYDLFPGGMCPIVNILLPSRVDLEHSSETAVYMIDLAKIPDVRLAEIARRLAAAAGADPARTLDEIKQRGLPLRVSQTNGCSTDVPFFL